MRKFIHPLFFLSGFLCFFPFLAFAGDATALNEYHPNGIVLKSEMRGHNTPLLEKIRQMRGIYGEKSTRLLEQFSKKKREALPLRPGFLSSAFEAQNFRAQKKEIFDLLREINQSIKAETESRIRSLSPQEQSELESITPNYVYMPLSFETNDPLLSLQNGLQSLKIDKISPADANAPKVVVAVIDQGIDFTHADMQHQAWTGGASCKDAQNQPIPGGCPLGGYDVFGNDNDPSQEDGNDHGTKVSSVIAAENNNEEGMASPGGSHVEIMAIRACCGTFGVFQDDDIVEGIYFAVNNGAQIINLSLGGPVPQSLAIRSAIDYAKQHGVLVVAAAGDNAQDNDLNDFYPANFSRDFDNVISVTSLDSSDNLLGNEGDETIDIAAPGQGIIVGGSGPVTPGGASTYKQENGSSYSAAFVSGALGVLGRGFTGGYLALKQKLFNQLETLSSLQGKVKGAKILRFKDPILPPPAPSCVHPEMTASEKIEQPYNRIKVWWQPVAGATQYFLRMVSGPVTFLDRSTPINNRYATGLVPGNYAYEVRAERDGLVGPACTGSFVATGDPVVPAPSCVHPEMTPVEIIEQTNSRVKIVWQPVNGVTEYLLRMISGPVTFADRSTPNNYRFANGLVPGNYTYEVRAKKDGVTSAPCTGSFTAVLPVVVPAPSCVHPEMTPTEKIDPLNNRVKVWWQPVTGATEYFLRMVSGPVTFGDRSTPINYRYATGLVPGNYTYEVRAKKDEVTSAPCTGSFTAQP